MLLSFEQASKRQFLNPGRIPTLNMTLPRIIDTSLVFKFSDPAGLPRSSFNRGKPHERRLDINQSKMATLKCSIFAQIRPSLEKSHQKSHPEFKYKSKKVLVVNQYHVPRSWLKSQNLVVVFEEWGGDPNGISL
ncbi:unnamed protein product, partial [Thlaspi arvense]